jgi:hypothetical protein
MVNTVEGGGVIGGGFFKSLLLAERKRDEYGPHK